jgi:hypothetical protein
VHLLVRSVKSLINIILLIIIYFRWTNQRLLNQAKQKIFDLLKVEALRNLIEVQEDVNIEVSKNKGVWGDALPENEFELCFYSEKIINDVDKLEKIYELFIVIINRLLEMKVIKQRPKR